MDTDLQSFTFPVSAIRSVRTPSGLTMEQAVPESYVLANFVLRALQERDEREIEFLVKSHLPLQVIIHQKAKKIMLVEPLGFTSTSYKLLPLSDFTGVSDRIAAVESPSELVESMRDLSKVIPFEARPEPTTFLGLISNPLAMNLLQHSVWPASERSDPYAITLPALVEKKRTDERVEVLQDFVESADSARQELPEILDVIEERVNAFVNSVDSEDDETVARLDARIESLSITVDELSSRLAKLESAGQKTKAREVSGILKKRESALGRDKERVAQLLSSRESVRKDLGVGLEDLKKRVESLLISIDSSTGFLDLLPNSVSRCTRPQDCSKSVEN
ncbi:MAG: hypothetical protein ACW992_09095 [Candidatus Thorarchaeota archaeon]